MFPKITNNNQTHTSGGTTYVSVLLENRWKKRSLTTTPAEGTITTEMLASKAVTPDKLNLAVWEASAPPSNPVFGRRYLITAPTSGDFAGKENQLARYDGTQWIYDIPYEGEIVWDVTTQKLRAWDGNAWNDGVKGLKGDAGDKGDKGDPGSKGDQGPQGLQGPAGSGSSGGSSSTSTITTSTVTASVPTGGAATASTSLAIPAAGKYFTLSIISAALNNAAASITVIRASNATNSYEEGIMYRAGKLVPGGRDIAPGSVFTVSFTNDGTDIGGTCTATLEMAVFN